MEEREIIILIDKFSSISNKLLNSTDDNGTLRVLRQFINFIDTQPTIKKFIDDNQKIVYNMEEFLEHKTPTSKYLLPEDPSEEISFIYQLLKYGAKNFNSYLSITGYGYAFRRGSTVSDKIYEFNSEVVSNLVGYIEGFLREQHIKYAKDVDTGRNYIFNAPVSQFNNAEKGDIDARQYNYKSEDTSELITITKDLIALIKEYEIEDDETKEDALDFLEEVGGALESGQEVKPSLIRRTTQKLEDITTALGASDALALKVTKFLETISSVIPQ
ncbi:hypothetical protein [Bacillus halotolerans]|uniref:hypothetical protein n=1 Tax=Bacillus halotolerans TaxID=260554 RepID=UPI003F6ABC39